MVNIEVNNNRYLVAMSGIESIQVYEDDIQEFIKQLSSLTDKSPIISSIYNSDKKVILINIVWDESIMELMNDMYYIEKGVKELACEAVDIWLKQWVKEYCSEEGFYIKKINWNPCDHDKNVYRFFMYKDERLNKLIEYINAIHDDDARDILIGFALGYKPHEMADFIKRTKGNPKY